MLLSVSFNSISKMTTHEWQDLQQVATANNKLSNDIWYSCYMNKRK